MKKMRFLNIFLLIIIPLNVFAQYNSEDDVNFKKDIYCNSSANIYSDYALVIQKHFLYLNSLSYSENLYGEFLYKISKYHGETLEAELKNIKGGGFPFYPNSNINSKAFSSYTADFDINSRDYHMGGKSDYRILYQLTLEASMIIAYNVVAENYLKNNLPLDKSYYEDIISQRCSSLK